MGQSTKGKSQKKKKEKKKKGKSKKNRPTQYFFDGPASLVQEISPRQFVRIDRYENDVVNVYFE